jgi:hypothetical protein
MPPLNGCTPPPSRHTPTCLKTYLFYFLSLFFIFFCLIGPTMEPIEFKLLNSRNRRVSYEVDEVNSSIKLSSLI